MLAPREGITRVDATRVVVVAVQKASSQTHSGRALVEGGANVLVVASGSGQLGVLARTVGVTRVGCTLVAVVAEAFVRDPIAVVVHAVAGLGGWFGSVADGRSFRAAHDLACAGAKQTRALARASQKRGIDVVDLAIAVVVEVVARFDVRDLSDAVGESLHGAGAFARACSVEVLVGTGG